MQWPKKEEQSLEKQQEEEDKFLNFFLFFLFMQQNLAKKFMEKQGCRFVGSHSVVKVCYYTNLL